MRTPNTSGSPWLNMGSIQFWKIAGPLGLVALVCTPPALWVTIWSFSWKGLLGIGGLLLIRSSRKKTAPARLEKRWWAMVETREVLTHSIVRLHFRNINKDAYDVLAGFFSGTGSLEKPVALWESALTTYKGELFTLVRRNWVCIGPWQSVGKGKFREVSLTRNFRNLVRAQCPFLSDWDGKVNPLTFTKTTREKRRFESSENGGPPYRERRSPARKVGRSA